MAITGKKFIRVVAALLFDEAGRILITQRLPGAQLEGLWEFPGGKIHEGETPEQALVREIKEELDLVITIGELFWEETFDYGIKTIRLAFYFCNSADRESHLRPREVADYRWVYPADLGAYEFPPADAQLIQKLISVNDRQ
jgi:mutator protein MutT